MRATLDSGKNGCYNSSYFFPFLDEHEPIVILSLKYKFSFIFSTDIKLKFLFAKLCSYHDHSGGYNDNTTNYNAASNDDHNWSNDNISGSDDNSDNYNARCVKQDSFSLNSYLTVRLFIKLCIFSREDVSIIVSPKYMYSILIFLANLTRKMK